MGVNHRHVYCGAQVGLSYMIVYRMVQKSSIDCELILFSDHKRDIYTTTLCFLLNVYFERLYDDERDADSYSIGMVK